MCCLEKKKWLAVFLLFCLAAVSNHYITPLWRIFSVVFFSFSAIVAGLLTKKGQTALSFINSAKIEMRKVTWPTYQETLHTTVIVAIVIFSTSLVIWGLDSILVFLISFITFLRF